MQETEIPEIKLTAEDIETLKKIHVSQAIKQTTQTPGWEMITDMVRKIINRMEDQHLRFAREASRDAYWAHGLILAGAREALQILQDQIVKEVNLDLTPPTARRLED